MPVENEQAMHVYEMHHVMAHFPIVLFTFSGDCQGNTYRKGQIARASANDRMGSTERETFKDQ